MTRRKAQQSLRFADVSLAVPDIARTEFAVVWLLVRDGLPYFALNVEPCEAVAQGEEELIEGGAVADGHVVDLVQG